MLVLDAVAASAQTLSPTFNRDVAPILWTHCSSCHRPGQSAPFSLVTFEDVRPHARAVLRAVEARTMPPWKPEPNYGDFDGVRRLSSHEIEILQQWAETGFQRGADSERQTPPQWTTEWQLGTPDLIVTMAELYALEPTGADVFRTFVMPIPVDAPRQVRALELKPEPSAAVHHANIKIDRSPSSRLLDDEEPGPGYAGGGSRQSAFPDGHFLGWTPGQSPRVLPDDMSWRLDRDTDLVVETHLMPTGTIERVRLSVGLYFTDRPASRAPYTLRLSRQDIDIPASERVVLSDSFVLPVDVDVLGVQPHAHYLATEVRAFATLPGGTSKGLILIKNWDFHWQDSYRYRTPLRLPRGTALSLRYVYDNTSANPRNPNRPPKRVTFGQTTASEMASLWVQVVTENERDRRILDSQFAAKLLRDDIQGYRKMLEVTPSDAGVHAALGHAYREAAQSAEAIAHFEHSVRLQPTAPTHYALASALLDERRSEEAAAHFSEALKLKPNFAEAAYGLGVVRHQEQRLNEAIRAYRLALGLKMRFRDAHYNLGRALTAAGQSSAAIAELRHALELDPEDAQARAGLGAALAADNQAEAAVREYRKALAISPDLETALVDLAWVLATSSGASTSDIAEAVRMAERAATLTGYENAVVLDTLAAAYAAAGQIDRAITTADTAMRLAQVAGEGDLAARIGQRLAFYQRNRH
jgi:tetratricopeptide (TPR) repeat protein